MERLPQFELTSDQGLDRILIAIDESLKAGATMDVLSHVIPHELSDNQPFEDAKRCIELLTRLFRRPSLSPLAHADDQFDTRTLDDPLLSNPSLGSRYHIQRVLGSGAMGVVYEAFDRQRNVSVALKKLKDTSAARLLHFKQEFRRLAKVAHENLVVLFEMEQADDAWFITMEYVDGTSFDQAVRSAGIQLELERSAGGSALALKKLAHLLMQVASGLQALHRAGIVHRDLKPTNVLVTPLGRAVVIDFGLATSFQWSELAGGRMQELVGTFAYMAPEQVTCQRLTPACDWYSLGIMLYEALTGSLPVYGTLPLLGKQFRAPPGFGNRLSRLPAPWSDLCQELLACQAEDRPSGPEVLRRLSQLAEIPLATSIVGVLNDSSPELSSFVGREPELAQLRSAWAGCLQGQPVCVSLQGASGIGKTSLVDHFLTSIWPERQPLILRGRCYQYESLPHKTLDSLVDALVKHLSNLDGSQLNRLLPQDAGLLVRVFPVFNGLSGLSDLQVPEAISEVEPVVLRRYAFAALRQLWINLAADVPLVMVIDDFQWGDRQGAAVLADLMRSAQHTRMMIVLVHRDEPTDTNECVASLQLSSLPAFAKETTSSFSHLNIGLQPLTPLQAAELARKWLANSDATVVDPALDSGLDDGKVDHSLAARIAHESGGLPFYVQELARHVRESSTATASATSDSTAISLQRVLEQRVSALSDQARRVLSIVAISVQPLSIELAGEAADLNVIDGRMLHQLLVQRWLRALQHQGQTTTLLYHDRLREAVLAELSETQVQTLHGQLASVLERKGSIMPETLAYHFDVAQHHERARHYFILAGLNAQRVYAFEKAVEHYRRALELQPSPAESSRLWQLLAEALGQAGRGGEAAAAYLQAARFQPQEVSLSLHLDAARQYCISGYTDEGRDLLRSVLAANGIAYYRRPLPLLASLIYQRLQLQWQGWKFHARSEKQLMHQALQRIDLLWDAVSGLSFQEPVAVAALHTRGLRAALKLGEPQRIVRALAMEAILSSTAGPTANRRVTQLMQLASDLNQSSGNTDTTGMLEMARGAIAFLQVRMPDAIEPLTVAEKIFSSRVPKAWWELTTTRSLLTWANMHMGNYRALRECVESYQRDASERGDRFLLSSITSAGLPQLHLIADRPDAAQGCLDALEQSVPYKQFQQYHVSMLYSQAQIDLYRDQGRSAWMQLQASWPRLRRSMQFRNQFARVTLTDLRARTALAAYRHGNGANFLTQAQRGLRQLESEHGQWVSPLAARLRAGIYIAQGLVSQAAECLHQAHDGFFQLGFHTCALLTQRHALQLDSTTLDHPTILQLDSQLTALGVKNIPALQRVLG